MICAVIESDSDEVTIRRQGALSDYGAAVTSALRALPREVANSLMGKYQAPSAEFLQAVETAIAERENLLEDVAQATPDAQWLADAGGSRRINESSLSEPDPWNSGG